ncbi:MAG: hypothetical protein Q8P15_00605 [Nanoarchaeota archaeon]|nr:hypothetical protein [Nanoarchaeota archaeon]
MLTEEQMEEIREHLEKAQNPVFFFDNDPDGLCAFLLLKRYAGKGKGVAIRSFPDLTVDYFRKIHELNADYVFILDKPLVSKDFFDEVEKHNIPVVWIDHHEPQEVPDFVNYYNPLLNEERNEPVTYLCYKMCEKKEDIWIAVIGCIFDKFIPEFYSEFEEKYPDLSTKYDDAFDVFYKSQIGKIAKIFSFGLKDRTTNVVNMLRFLSEVKSPYEVLEEGSKNYSMHNRFRQIDTKYQKLLDKALLIGEKPGYLLFFQYQGDLSISGDLANELNYRFPGKTIVVVYVSGTKANISARGSGVRGLILKTIDGFQDSTGGGHEEAVGAKIRVEDIGRFKRRLERFA